jgi:predicted MPP superfamily phosphohydrolase
MGHRIRILHISDMHDRGPRDPEAWRRKAVLDTSWLENLRGITSEGAIDLVCFTGDITQSGSDDEYESAEKFTEASLAALGLDRTRLFIVPGNHDVDRNCNSDTWRDARARLLEMPALERSRLVRSPDAQLKAVLQRQQSFWTWLERLGLADLLPRNSAHGHLGFRKTLRLPGRPFDIHVVGLNSAWLSGDGNDAGKLELTEDQVIRLATSDGTPLPGLRVALVHHPLSDMRDMSQARRDLSVTAHAA